MAGDRFVAGGTLNASGEATKPAEEEEKKREEDEEAGPRVEVAEGATSQLPQSTGHRDERSNKRNAEWEAVQKELDEERKRREEQRVKAASGEEKSLYDILQANQAAKQAAFEEANKIRNQFRALDDDEAEFLSEVRERERIETERVRKETEEGLKAFRAMRREEDQYHHQQYDGTGGGNDEGEAENGDGAAESWGVARKRKRKAKSGRETFGVKRKVSADHDKDKGQETTDKPQKQQQQSKATINPAAAAAEDGKGTKVADETKTADGAAAAEPPPKKTASSASSLGLVAYDSDDSDT